MISLVSAFVWLWADVASGHNYVHPLYHLWNALVRLSFFLIITLLLSELKNALEREKDMAQTDYLTGAVNARLFFKLVQMEVDRFCRTKRAFTLVYIDLDNFKTVNDHFGHSKGDDALCTVVSYAKQYLRKIDVIARLGGDEFALLLPETSQEYASIAIIKLQDALLEEMQRNNWPITFSIGVMTCNAAPPNTDVLIKLADDLMYSVKNNSKNAIKYATYTG